MEGPNKKFRFIIDTGAEFSIVNHGVYDPKWNIKMEPQKLLALGKTMSTNSKFRVPLPGIFNCNYYVEFLEFNFHNKFDGILGNNILVNLKAIVNYGDRLLMTDTAVIPFYLNEEEENYAYGRYIDDSIHVLSFESDGSINNFASHLNRRDTHKLSVLLRSYGDLFFDDSQNLSFTNEIKHSITTKNDIPVYSKMYRYPEIFVDEVDKQVDDMLRQGIITNSNSPYNAPIWVVPKKIDSSNKQKYRLVIDYRKLNEQCIDDRYPIPNISDIFDKLGRCQYFTTIDLAKGFHQIEVTPADRHKTAFSTKNGHYEFVRMPFGLKNAPATFQRLMNNILREFINKICVVYLDDILIFSTSLEEHLDSLGRILQRLRESNMKLQIDKCHFAERQTEYLGHVVTNGCIKPNPNKVDAINTIDLPTTQKEIKSFLGMTGYYRKFIKDYAKVAYPMIKYLKKNGSRISTNDLEYVDAFRKLKALITSGPVLNSPDFNKTFVLTTDASNYAIGAVLSQCGHPIAFSSRTLNNHEKNYSVIEKELLAVVWSTKYFRPYLFGRRFTIRTDHRPLVWLNSLREPNSKLQRWKIQLNEYDYTIEYIKGRDNVVADGLSRIGNNALKTEANNSRLVDEEVLLSNGVNDFEININDADGGTGNGEEVMSTDATVHSAGEDSGDHIKITEKPINLYKNQIYLSYGDREKITTKILHGRVQNNIEIDRNNENLLNVMRRLLIDKGLMCVHCEDVQLFVKFQNLYVEYFSKNKNLTLLLSTKRLEDVRDKDQMLNAIKQEHLRNNHRGINEVYSELKLKLFYPNMRELTHRFINQCEICQLAKFDRNPPKIPFEVSETPKNFNDIVHMDIWHPYRNIMYVSTIDKFSKYATLYKIGDRTWISILQAIKSRIQNLGKMNKLVSDGERCIVHSAVEQFLRESDITFHQTTAHNKTGNSDVERLHGTLNEHLRIVSVDGENTEGDENLDDKLFRIMNYYNNTIHSTTGARPIDFITKNLTNEEIEGLHKRFHEQKLNRIQNLNLKRDHVYSLTPNIVKNRNIAKNSSKYRKLDLSSIDSRKYITDTSNRRRTKYCQNQRKRRYKYQ